MIQPYPAHIRGEADGRQTVQTVEEHCRGCAGYAADASLPSLRNAAYLAGLIHDMGKYTAEFRDYITRAAAGETVRRGSVNHTFAGVRFALERWHSPLAPPEDKLACEVIAVAAGAHHGLFDCFDVDGKDGFSHRQTRPGIGFEEAKEQFLSCCSSLEELDALFARAQEEIWEVVEKCRPFLSTDSEMRFCLSLLSRLLLSAVIDADRRDTEEFLYGVQSAHRSHPADGVWQSRLEEVERQLKNMESKKPINVVRGEISDRCRKAAGRPCGIFRLSVPTGGGKTLAGLRYALAAAGEHRKKRILFVIPLLSVLDQNAAEIRKAVADDSLILEHHSNLVREKTQRDELDENELLMESWDSPIVITTLVQLLNTLFDGRTSCIRRMQALADSILVIDEVQSVPRNMLSLFNLAMNFLSAACNCTVVLCSATQPCLEKVSHALRYGTPPDLIAADAALWEVFRRTDLVYQQKEGGGGYSYEEAAEFVLEQRERSGSLLMICNTKKDAENLYHLLKQQWQGELFHLSTFMCMAHRMDTLERIKRCLTEKRPVLCVSTQLVEAGVDFSFGCVVRALAGLDNAIQAAGRCNRHGEFDCLCPVYLIELQPEKLTHLQEIQQAQWAAKSVLSQFDREDPQWEGHLASDPCVRAYYSRLYTDMPHNTPDYPLKDLDSSLFALLSDNRAFERRSGSQGKYLMTQAFQTAGSRFQVFDDDTVDILVPYGEGIEVIANLRSEKGLRDFHYRKEQLQKGKPFSISLRRYQVEELLKQQGVVSPSDSCCTLLQPEFYSKETGLDLSGSNLEFRED